jgi:CPA1 family monovalent cation:H+ antiporter
VSAAAVAATEAHTELVVAALLLAIVVLVTAARVLSVPYPIFLVIGGGALGFIPGMPEVRLDPDLVLLIFLPPLLYSAAFFTSLRELRRNVRPISMLAVGLVLATCGAVAAVAHALIDGLDWPAAFVLGAIVSPTDPVAATAIARRIGVPQRVVDIVEGESLINDATALVAYRVAVGAVVTGSFSMADAGGRFLLGAIGGIAIGLAVGWVVANVRERLDDPPVEITISILTAYLAYLPAEELGASGVVAAVTVGLYMGSQTSRVTTVTVRIQSGPVWQILIFLLNSLLFVLIGLQLPAILERLPETGVNGGDLVLYALAVSLTVILVRMAFTFVTSIGLGFQPDYRNVSLIGWMGMRGAVSLAAALALPQFPQRDLIVFLTFAVILATLVVQGLSLPAVIRLLGIERDESKTIYEENKARVHAARAALAHIEALAGEDWANDDSLERARRLYDYRDRRFSARFDDDADDSLDRRTAGWVRITQSIIEAQRQAIEQLRRDGVISDDVMRRVEFELDLEETRLLA